VELALAFNSCYRWKRFFYNPGLCHIAMGVVDKAGEKPKND
jgi:hypothetical protein